MTEPNVIDLTRPSASRIPLQDASMDIWDGKYRLKQKDGTPVDQSIHDSHVRVARALAEVESEDQRQHHYDRFLWALDNGAIPAGRILSNAGAQAFKPATSTINCTVSGTIDDSMSGILDKLHEAGMTLKGGSGIGYDFSTLRPKGAYVSGADAFTSGPLSFMDIYDSMCMTISSAGGRRGAQMATFDIGHPDVLEFIRAKHEDGRLRQFNLSLLITEAFVDAVKNDEIWHLAFPVTEEEIALDEVDLNDSEKIIWRDWPAGGDYPFNTNGQVACRIYKSLPARRLWDAIMSSTYDFAEPGFILIDRVNEMNTNWFCEEIRATNPCVTADSWVHTSTGPRQVADLIGRPFTARVDGQDHPSGPGGFFRTAVKPVVLIQTREGYRLRLTSDHRVRRISSLTRWRSATEWCAAGDLCPDDKVLLNNHSQSTHWRGEATPGHELNQDNGYLMGLLVGDGTLKKDKAVLSVWKPALRANGSPEGCGADTIMSTALRAAGRLPHRADFTGWHAVSRPGAASGFCEYRLSLNAIRQLATTLGMKPGRKTITPAIESASSGFYRGFLRGLFDSDGSVQGSPVKGVSIRLAQSDLEMLRATQRMLLRLGIASNLYESRRRATHAQLPDGRGGEATYPVRAQHELAIAKDNLRRFSDEIGFCDSAKADRLTRLLTSYQRGAYRERYTARVVSVTPDGCEDVYDTQVPGINTFDANGLHTHNCGEQPLPPYGACLLGSVNLTCFVRDPFTEQARFDWDRFREVVTIFTRMLDNVVEIHGLALDRQTQEIERKRRHGMGFLGLGSTLVMLRMSYGDEDSLAFTEEVTRELAVCGWREGLALAREKGSAPIMTEHFTLTPYMMKLRPELAEDGYKVGDDLPGSVLHARYSRYMQQLAGIEPELVEALATQGSRFTHHSSIAPTGTISLSLANNASNGIEPSFAHHYARNIVREGRKTKEKVDVYSYELLAYRALINPDASPDAEAVENRLPDYFVTAEEITPTQHVDIQAAAQKWIDSSISKTANVPSDYPFDDFKDIYMYACDKGLKGCTTFRFNPEQFQGVLVRDQDLRNTLYRFTLEDGQEVELKGDEEVEYEGEVHTAANLYDAIKEGYYGRY